MKIPEAVDPFSQEKHKAPTRLIYNLRSSQVPSEAYRSGAEGPLVRNPVVFTVTRLPLKKCPGHTFLHM